MGHFSDDFIMQSYSSRSQAKIQRTSNESDRHLINIQQKFKKTWKLLQQKQLHSTEMD